MTPVEWRGRIIHAELENRNRVEPGSGHHADPLRRLIARLGISDQRQAVARLLASAGSRPHKAGEAPVGATAANP